MTNKTDGKTWELDRQIDNVIDLLKENGFTKYSGELINGWTFNFLLPKRNQKKP